jgi:predicted transcriptional regulator
MKTTIEISDAILKRAKQLAARRNTTLRELIETALRDALERELPSARSREVRTHTFRGNGLQSGLSWDEWSTIRDLAYEGRGA